MKKLRGFTLAETLITLFVIGVIASIVMPMLNKATPNKEMMMLRKAYYLTSRIVTELINDEDLYPDSDNVETAGFANINLTPAARYHGQEYNGPTKFCGLFAARLSTKGNIDCDKKYGAFSNTGLDSGGNFETTDGIVWRVPTGDDGTFNDKYVRNIYVDVNGDDKPNCFSWVGGDDCPNPDRFRFGVDKYGKISVDENTKIMLTARDITKTYKQLYR